MKMEKIIIIDEVGYIRPNIKFSKTLKATRKLFSEGSIITFRGDKGNGSIYKNLLDLAGWTPEQVKEFIAIWDE